jgi:hypothetical protein
MRRPKQKGGSKAENVWAGGGRSKSCRIPTATALGLQFETGEHGGDYPDNIPQAITVIDAQGRWGGVRSATSQRQDRGAVGALTA